MPRASSSRRSSRPKARSRARSSAPKANGSRRSSRPRARPRRSTPSSRRSTKASRTRSSSPISTFRRCPRSLTERRTRSGSSRASSRRRSATSAGHWEGAPRTTKADGFGREPRTLLHSTPVTEGSKVQEERRRQILHAAVRAFARKGYHACRVSDIAKEAGVAYGLVYHYYRSKETLLEAIFKGTWGAMLGTIRSVEQLDEPAREQVRKVTEIVLRTWKRDPELVRVLVREVTRSSQVQQETEEIELAYEALQRIVEQGQQTGEFRGDLDARLTATIWYGALEEILTGWAFGQLPDREDDVTRAERAVVEIVAGGLAADRAATPA